MKTVYFIRHAESEANAGLATTDDASIVLTSKGKQQALEVANSIAVKPDLIICVGFHSTQLTANPLRHKFPNVRYHILPLNKLRCLPTRQCSGRAESFNQFAARIDSVLQCLEYCEAQNIIVFTHGHVLRAIWQQLSGIKFSSETERMHHFYHEMSLLPVPNTCIFKATYQYIHWQIIEPQLQQI